MAVTRVPYTDLEDGEIDAESPYIESIPFRLRDQPYSAMTDPATAAPLDWRLSLPLRAKTIETNQELVLTPDGVGGAVWSNTPRALDSIHYQSLVDHANPGPGTVKLDLITNNGSAFTFIDSATVQVNVTGVYHIAWHLLFDAALAGKVQLIRNNDLVNPLLTQQFESRPALNDYGVYSTTLLADADPIPPFDYTNGTSRFVEASGHIASGAQSGITLRLIQGDALFFYLPVVDPTVTIFDPSLFEMRLMCRG